MRNPLRWTLLGVLLVAVCVLTVNFSPAVSSQSIRKGGTGNGKTAKAPLPALENFDIRDRSANAIDAAAANQKQNGKTLVVERAKARPLTQAQLETAAALAQTMRAGEAGLAGRVSGLKVEYNEMLHVPELVSVNGAGALSAASPLANAEAHEATLRAFLNENTQLYGLTSTQAAQLTKVSDYTNPAGNLSFVELQQEINDIPVFQGYVRGVMATDGRLVRTTGLLAPVVNAGALPTTPALSATEGVAAGAAGINVQLDASNLSVLDRAINGRAQVVSRGPFDEDTKIELVYFPLAPGHLVLAYSMTLWQPVNAYYVLVDAQTGTLLWRKNITQDQAQPVTYNIYNDDSPTPSSPTTLSAPGATLPPGIARTDVTEVSENAADNTGWIPDGAGNAVTTGNNVDAGLDIVTPNGIDPTGRATATGRVFSFPYIPDGATDPTGSSAPTDTNYRMGIVTNIFFWTNRYHDRLYDLGFTEAARNFQTDNFGRGGLGNDFVRAEAQDSSGTNNANFSTPADGSLPRMQMYIFTTSPVNRDGDVDQDVNQHELTHGVSNRLHANATGLGSTSAGGMGEGWSDFYAISLLSSVNGTDTGAGIYAYGGYVTKNYYYGIRRFPYAVRANVGANGKPHNPLTFADIDPTQINLSDGANPPAFVGTANEVHNAGELWCSTLLEVRQRLIARLGFPAGNQRTLQVVTDGMKLDPVNPTQLDGRNSLLAADCAGFAGADELDIWDAFKTRGMGFRAGFQLGGDGKSHVLENFDGPNLTLGTVTATETSGNGNGQFDPGETVSLSVPLSNTLCATSGVNVTATLSPGFGSTNYGTIAPSTNATQQIPFTIPTDTACGSAIPITITVNSATLGPITYDYALPIGRGAALSSYENFDGVTAPALPSGWTTSHVGAGLGWVTSAANPDTLPNAASTGDQANEGTNYLLSPPIPVNTALGQLSFRNLYNLESGFDSMSLQIKIGSGPFQDIIAAGGSFVSGGYNSNIGWTGLSGGTTSAPTYITTAVNLPAAANGQFVQLRWSVHSDANTIAAGAAGASIDTIQLSTTAQPCASFGVTTVALSGRVTDSAANGLGGIQITLSGTTNVSTITDSNGNYSFAGLVSGGNYTVTPTTPGLEYTPPSQVFNNLTTNVTNANFVAIPVAGIGGRVTTPNGAQGIDGITITLSGSSAAATTTAGGGFYSFSPLTRHGNYTVTPSGGNNNFAPPSRTFNDLNSAVTNANFVALETVGAAPTPTPPNAKVGQVLITEYRASGGNGTTLNTSDEYIELYNNTDAPISIGGYQVAVFFGGGDATLTLPNPTVIPRRGHYLIVGNAYSLASYATANITVTTANFIAENSGTGLLDPATGGFIDSLGFVNQSGSLPYIEGVGLTRTGTKPAIQYAYIRKINPLTTFPQDTDNNAADFQLVSVTGAVFPATGGGPTVPSVLGAPGPENTASPVERSVFDMASPVDPTNPSTGGENRKRFLTCGVDPAAPACPQDPTTSALGYLSIRRKVTNNSGVAVTRLRFRIVDITTAGSPGAGAGQADLRALSSSTISVLINGTPTTIEGTTLEQPPTQSLGGGLNSSMNVGAITLGTPLANGASVNVQFMLGVQQSGNFRFFVTVDALP
ncbi:MAG: M36 family metallopeptidase [Pyrinomonadaceae bacterium]